MEHPTRAGRVVGPGRIVCDGAEVEPLRDGDVLVRTHFASICGSDLHVVYDSVFADPALLVPGFPGHEGIGEVIDSRHADHQPGERVLCLPGAFSEMRCFAEVQRVRGGQVITVDGSGPVQSQLMAQQLGTVLFALRRHPPRVEGATAVVLGQGSAGLFWTFLLKAAGAARVIVADPNRHRLDVAAGFGADVLLHPPGDDVAAAVDDLTGGVGADYVVEAVGNAGALSQSVSVARTGGTVFWFGLPDRMSPVPFDHAGFFLRKLSAHTVYGAQDEPGLVSFHEALDLIAGGLIDVRPLLSHVISIEAIGDAFELAHSGDDGAIKVLLSF